MKSVYMLCGLFVVIRCQTLTPNITTIWTNEDATSLARSRPTIYGSIVIDNAISGTIDLEGIKTILGNLTCEDNPNLTSISSSTLLNITGTMHLNNLTTFSNLEFPNLERVGKISWIELPALSRPILTSGVRFVDEVRIEETAIMALDKIMPKGTNDISIRDNPFLKSCSIPLVPTGGNAYIRNNTLLTTIDLGDVLSVRGVYIFANNTQISGMQNLKKITSGLFISMTSDFSCQQFNTIQTGDITCTSENSSYSITKYKNGTSSLHDSHPYNYETDPPVTSGSTDDPEKIVIAFIVAIIVTPIIICTIIVLYRNRVKHPRAPLVFGPEIPELPLGGHNEKSELETYEKPGELELSVLMGRKPDSQIEVEVDGLAKSRAKSKYANILDVREMDDFLVRDVEDGERSGSMDITRV